MSDFSKSSAAARAAMRQKVVQRQERFVQKHELQALLSRGFRGWHAGPNLPHFDAPNICQFITLRLADTLPQPTLELARSQAADPTQIQWIDQQLDAGLGACWLRRPDVAELTQEAILWFHGTRYDVLAWVIMPNHVHCVIKLGADLPMAKIVSTWKSVTAHRINRILGRKGTVWQTEVWDHYLRNGDELLRTIDYIEGNPVSAHLTATSDPQEWPWSSARWRQVGGTLDVEAARGLCRPDTDRLPPGSCHRADGSSNARDPGRPDPEELTLPPHAIGPTASPTPGVRVGPTRRS